VGGGGVGGGGGGMGGGVGMMHAAEGIVGGEPASGGTVTPHGGRLNGLHQISRPRAVSTGAIVAPNADADGAMDSPAFTDDREQQQQQPQHVQHHHQEQHHAQQQQQQQQHQQQQQQQYPQQREAQIRERSSSRGNAIQPLTPPPHAHVGVDAGASNAIGTAAAASTASSTAAAVIAAATAATAAATGRETVRPGKHSKAIPPLLPLTKQQQQRGRGSNRTHIRWQRGEVIGQGAFGKVFLGMNLDTGELMAVKHIDTEVASRDIGAMEHEVLMLRTLHHENIVRYMGTERSGDTLSIFLEYVPGGSVRSLLDRFGCFEEAVIRTYARQLLLGLEYLHSNGIAHRDIKGERAKPSATRTSRPTQTSHFFYTLSPPRQPHAPSFPCPFSLSLSLPRTPPPPPSPRSKRRQRTSVE